MRLTSGVLSSLMMRPKARNMSNKRIDFDSLIHSIQELKEKDALIVKLMRSFEENERETSALRQRIAGREELAAEKETIQVSSVTLEP